jgi:hypothetical protein
LSYVNKNKQKMGKLHTCLFGIILLSAIAYATHNHHKHLDLEFVYKEAVRLSLLEQHSVYRKIDNNREAVKIIAAKYAKAMKTAKSAEEGKATWKKEYESHLADDIDRAIIAETVCKLIHGPPEKCAVGIKWEHPYETRDSDLKKEFLAEVDETIKRAIKDTLKKDL